MELRDLVDSNWKKWERDRFIKDSTKAKTEAFDPESFKHDGFQHRERYLETYAPALADSERLEQELNTFDPPRLGAMNDSPYQALAIRYGILRLLIQQPGYQMEKQELLEGVQSWQRKLIDDGADMDPPDDDDLLHLARAAIDHGSDIDDSELNMIYSYFELRNRALDNKHQYYTWRDFFKRLSWIDRFPKVSRSEKPAHALDTIEKGLWSLQEQAIVYEIVDPDRGDVVGIPEDYVDFISDWLYYEMSDENFLNMLEELDPFRHQSVLIEARDEFDITTGTQGYNDRRRESIVEAGVFPSDLLERVLVKDQLKEIVDEYGLDAHKQKKAEMIEATIDYFEQSQRSIEPGEPDVQRYLAAYEDIADGNVEMVPPQLQKLVDDADPSTRLDVLFEEATAEIFGDVFNLDGTTLLGQGESGVVADGEIEQDGTWLLWDNKRRSGPFKLDADTRAKIKDYIDTKSSQHEVEWFLIIAPEFASSAESNAKQLEKQVGIDIRLVLAEDFHRLATIWQDSFAAEGRALPLSTFYGTGMFDVDASKEALQNEFA